MTVWNKVDGFFAGAFWKLRIVKVILKIPLSTAWLQLSGDDIHICTNGHLLRECCWCSMMMMMIANFDILKMSFKHVNEVN